MRPESKSLLLILDGLGDRPAPAFDGRTPLEAADTPHMDGLVARGLCGLVDPLRPGVPVDTQTGTGVLLGLPPREVARLPRGPVDAAGVGLTLQAGDVALRCNFATVEANGEGFRILDRRAGRISQGTAELAECVASIELADGIQATLAPAAQHRAVLRLSGPGLSGDVSDTDPGTGASDPHLQRSVAHRADQPGAVRTAAALNTLLHEVPEVLTEHPVNRDRVARGLPPANGLLTRGAGAGRPLRNILQRLELSTAVVAGDRTALGLAALSGFTRITRPTFTCLADTDLAAKAGAAQEALQAHDFVYVHVKATDVLSHDCDPTGKRDFLEHLDAAFGSLLAREDLVVGIAADHSTSSRTGRHTGDPVPAVLATPDGRRDRGAAFGETVCMEGGLGRISAAGFLRSVLDGAGAMPAYTPTDVGLYEG